MHQKCFSPLACVTSFLAAPRWPYLSVLAAVVLLFKKVCQLRTGDWFDVNIREPSRAGLPGSQKEKSLP